LKKLIDNERKLDIMHSMLKKWFFIPLILSLIFSCRAEDIQNEPVGDTTDKSYGKIVEKEEETLYVSIAAVGDIMMGSDFPTPILPPVSGKHIFDDVKEELKADIVFGNLEGPLCKGGYTSKNVKSGRSHAFRTPPEFAKNLADAGFNCVSIANNHARDFGIKGVKSTMNVLDSLNIEHSGPVGDIGRLEVNNLSVGLLAFSTYGSTYNILSKKHAVSTINTLSDSFDILIVSFHGGSEGTRALHTKDKFEYLYGEPRGNVVKFAHKAIDNGADLILGHGPHVPRALEIYRDRLIAYSLGNFVVYGRFSLKGATGKSFILKAKLKKDGSFVDGEIIPVEIKRPGIPVIDDEEYTTKLIRELSEEDFSQTAPQIDEEGNIFRSMEEDENE
jgi:poly-gamma-glutamate capsule biosynthesis protein CapA/YwtB (metallophosphatase superfamily)